MAKKMLTAGGIAKMKAGSARREIHDAGAPGLHLIIQKSGAKSFALRFRRPGGARAKLTLGPFNPEDQVGEPRIGAPLTLAAARALAAQINLERAGGVDVLAVQRVERRRRRIAVLGANTFGEAAQDFLKNHTVRKTGQRPRRWRETASLLGLHYPADGGEPTVAEHGPCIPWHDRPVASITADDVHDAIGDMASASMGRRMCDALGTMFKWLHQNRRIKVNPCLGVHRPPPPPSRHRVLSDAEMRELWQACDVVGEPFGPMLKILLLTGQRLNEIARLEDAELSDGMIRLPENRTKNRLPHDVPLAPLVKNLLAEVPRMPNCKYVFSTNGKTPVSGFSKLKAKIDGLVQINEPWVVHDLRRTAATTMAEKCGVAPFIVEAVLNHQSGAKASVAGIYNRATYADEKRSALESWANYVLRIIP